MIIGLGSSKAIVLAVSIVALTSPTKSNTCQKLEGLYQANADVVGTALEAFQQCASLRGGDAACPAETHDLTAAREILQASFSDFLKTCGSRLAGRERPGNPTRSIEPLRHLS